MANEGPRALLGLQNPSDFKFTIRANHCVGIDREIYCQLANGRQLIASVKRACRNSAHDLIDDLAVDGYPAPLVQSKLEGRS
jgi:hypothetical protein